MLHTRPKPVCACRPYSSLYFVFVRARRGVSYLVQKNVWSEQTSSFRIRVLVLLATMMADGSMLHQNRKIFLLIVVHVIRIVSR